MVPTRTSDLPKFPSEEDTSKFMHTICNFVKPFEVEDKDVLYCLSSGAPAPKYIEEDLRNADKVGKAAYNTFIDERLVTKSKSSHALIKKVNLKTFAKAVISAKLTALSKKSKQLTAERNVFGQLVLLALDHQISLERVLTFHSGPVSRATAIGNPVKKDKWIEVSFIF